VVKRPLFQAGSPIVGAYTEVDAYSMHCAHHRAFSIARVLTFRVLVISDTDTGRVAARRVWRGLAVQSEVGDLFDGDDITHASERTPVARTMNGPKRSTT